MAKKYFMREDVQKVLNSNPLGAKATYLEREPGSSPDNYIVYYRFMPNSSIRADDKIHMRKVMVEVVHYHKKKLDNIDDLMADNFGTEAIIFNAKQPDTDYFGTYFRFEILTGGDW